MRILLLLCALAIALLAAVATFNWTAIETPSPVSLGFVHIDASLGAILLVLCLVALASLAIYTAWQAVSNARRARETAKALEAQRALAEQVEVSRFNELRLALVSEFERFSSTLTATQDALRVEIQDSGNSIAAMLAEIDDRAKAVQLVSRDRRS